MQADLSCVDFEERHNLVVQDEREKMDLLHLLSMTDWVERCLWTMKPTVEEEWRLVMMTW